MSTAVTTQAISHISVVAIRVKNQDEALRFYTERLGFEKRMDADMGEGKRWLTVAPVGASTEIVLENETAEAKSGGWAGVILEAEDIDAAYRELSGRGVKFTELPIRHPWGGWAQLEDQDGNTFGLHSNP
jgi:lactoylglutathione lyase